MDSRTTVLSQLLSPQDGPCLSLYQPTHRQHPDNQQDPIRFRNLTRTLQESLQQSYPERDIGTLLAPLHALADDAEFWNHTADGLGVLATAGALHVFKLQRRVAELAVVADSFHIKPLLRILQSADRYQILALGRGSARLYEGNRDVLDEVTLADQVPQGSAAASDADIERDRGTRTHGRVEAGVMGRHGADEKQDAIDSSTEQFFRAVDRTVHEQHSVPSGLPLLMAALPEHHHLFRQVSQNPLLMAEAIESNPEPMSLDELRERAWDLLQPRYLQRLQSLLDSFGAAHGRGHATDDLAAAVTAAREGRVANLLIEADRVIPGRIDAESGAITPAPLQHPDVDDLLDDLAEIVLRNGGEVVIVPAERMPTRTGLAATLRY